MSTGLIYTRCFDIANENRSDFVRRIFQRVVVAVHTIQIFLVNNEWASFRHLFSSPKLQ